MQCVAHGMIEILMPVGTFLRSGLAVWEQESPHFREGRKSIIALLTNKYIWEALKDILVFFKILEIFLMMFIFYYLIIAWLEIFQNLQDKSVEKLKLEPNNPYEEFAFDDLENVNRIYWKVYLTYQESISANEKDSNTRYQSLEIARKYIKKALYLFCIFVYTLFLIFINISIKE